MKLFDSELKVMNVLWDNGDMHARAIADVLMDECGWNINTTYTVIKKCIAKGAIERIEPKFNCHALVTREEARRSALSELCRKLFDGDFSTVFSTLLDEDMSEVERQRIKEEIDKL